MKHTLLAFIVTTTAITACDSKPPQDDTQPDGVIPQHQLDALEKSKNVENLLKEADKKRSQSADGDGDE
ncbi:hypothetical protein L1F30_13305 [Simiduia sp. 21SJ11W-1]|uniref:hypothetical protein n=1 Tax=Simiduia sp. 21SJ11W-1 TaxID=2909669 RepID=UPI00209CE725|nr:hypothetical protein [Simiduia sp. 21SJ11W-1]UTA47134.1 hypothetical protein L1F30_13305 [Simiduia sp. 21SJ11W-1]